jgi:exosortase/archaeosortase family protein
LTAGSLSAGRGGRAAAGRQAHRSRHGHRRARGQQPGSSAAGLAGRLLACVACCAMAIAAVKENFVLRGFEAAVASHVVAFVTSMPAGPIPQTPTFWFTVAPHHEMGLEITSACTVVLMMTPFLIATALLVWRRSSAIRPVVACIVAVAMLMAVNQLRILTIIMFVLKMGFGGGFYWGHTLVGSLITVIGGSMTLVVYALIAIRRGTPGRGRRVAR